MCSLISLAPTEVPVARPSYSRTHDRTRRNSLATYAETIGMTSSGSCSIRVLHSCRKCGGSGVLREELAYQIGRETSVTESDCDECGGDGYIPAPRPIPYKELRSGVIDLQIDREINPTDGHLPDAFERLDDNHSAVYEEAEVSFDISARREIAQGDFGLEPLGLAMWWMGLPEQTGQLDPLSTEETQSLLRTVARILATENILLPPEPKKPWEWPSGDRVQLYEKQRIFPANGRQGQNNVPYNLQPHRKLGRYIRAIARRLVAGGRIHDVDSWLDQLRWPLWDALKGFRILVPAGRRVNDQTPFGIRIDSFELRPVGDTVFQMQCLRVRDGRSPAGCVLQMRPGNRAG